MEPKQKPSMDNIRPGGRSMDGMGGPARPRPATPRVSADGSVPVRTSAPQSVRPASAPVRPQPLRPQPSPRTAPLQPVPLGVDDPLADLELPPQITAHATPAAVTKKPSSFWRVFRRFFIVLIVLGLFSTAAIYIYLNFKG